MDLLAVDTACPLCGSRDAEFHLDDRRVRGGHILARAGAERIVRCQECGLGYRPSRPGDRELGTLYRELDDETYESERRGRWRTARRHLRIVESHTRSGRLLDVGCSSGMFLEIATAAGWQVAGIEPSAAMAGRARTRLGKDISIFEGMLHEWPHTDPGYDALTAWDVVEHSPDPLGFVQRCHDAVRPGGWVFLNVPDIESIQARLFGHRWPLLLPHHLCYFDLRSLTRCIEASGLELVRFGRRAASFSLGYVLLRLAEHGIPGVGPLRRLVPGTVSRSVIVPVPMGELFAVCRRPPSSRADADSRT